VTKCLKCLMFAINDRYYTVCSVFDSMRFSVKIRKAKKRRKSTCILYKISEVCKIYTENVHKTDHKACHKPYIIPRRLISLITQHIVHGDEIPSYSAILVTKYSHPSRHIATEFIQYKSKKKLDKDMSIC
jgi:hypothetical protein